MASQSIAIQINDIFEKNKLDDLIKFMKKRKNLNKANEILIYIFHIVQTSGILITTVAAGYGIKALVWVGAGINALASLIKIFESTNNAMLKKLMMDIKLIKAGNYVDEGALVDDEKAPPAPEPPSASTLAAATVDEAVPARAAV